MRESLAVALARQQHTPVQSRRYLSAAELAAAHGSAHRGRDGGDALGSARRGCGSGVGQASATTARAERFAGRAGACVRCHTRAPPRARCDHRCARGRTATTPTSSACLRSSTAWSPRCSASATDRPARPRLAVLPRGRRAAYSYTPEELARIYDFPVLDNGGAGLRITVGIAELGGAVYRPDLAAFTARNPRLRVVEEAVHGWGPDVRPFGPDTEVALDWQVIAGVLAHCAPQADVLVVIKYAPNTDRGFSNLEASFATDGRDYSAVSTSWGAPEDRWTPAAMDAMDRAFQLGALRGIVHSVAAGDNGSTDARGDGRQHADHPASAPHAVGMRGHAAGRRARAAHQRGGVERAAYRPGRDRAAASASTSRCRGTRRTPASTPSRPTTAARAWRARRRRQRRPAHRLRRSITAVSTGGRRHLGGGAAVDARCSRSWRRRPATVSATCCRRCTARATWGSPTSPTGDNGAYPAGPGWDASTGLGVPVGTRLCAQRCAARWCSDAARL